MDPNGIPYWSSDDIEEFAQAYIADHAADVLEVPTHTPVLEIALAVGRTIGLRIDVSKPLGRNSLGHSILGACYFDPPRICIDPELARDTQRPRFRFVLAHELGHLHLHRALPLDFTSLDAAPSRIIDTRHDLRLARRTLETPRDWLEWQANRFAAAILMPRRTFRSSLEAIQAKRDIRRLGHVFVDDQAHNRHAYRVVCEEMANLFRTSSAAVKVRLDQLALITDRRESVVSRAPSHGPIAIGDILRQMLAGRLADRDPRQNG